jgi:hypothetical protein
MEGFGDPCFTISTAHILLSLLMPSFQAQSIFLHIVGLYKTFLKAKLLFSCSAGDCVTARETKEELKARRKRGKTQGSHLPG